MSKKESGSKKRNSCYVVKRAFGSTPALPTFGDADGDGVPNFFDCQPRNPYKDGILRDVGEAVATRVKHEVSDIKEHAIEEIAGEEKRAERLEIEETRKEAYLKERKEAVREEARIKARAKIERHKEEKEERKERIKARVKEEEEERRERIKEEKEARKERIKELQKAKAKELPTPYTKRYERRTRVTSKQRPSPFSSGYLR